MDWLPSFQTLPFRAVGPLGQQLAGSTDGDAGGVASPPGRPCDGASWATAPPPVLPFQPGVGTEAARDILSLGAGYSCFESSGVMGRVGEAKGV